MAMRAFQTEFFGRWLHRCSTLLCLCLCVFPVACHALHEAPEHPDDKHQAAFFNRATSITYPGLECPDDRFQHLAYEPRTVRNEGDQEIWDLSLTECIQVCLSHSRVIRNQAQFSSPHNPLLTNPDGTPSIFDPAIQETGVLFGQRGVAAALSDFDAQFSTSAIWGRNEQVQNNTLSLGLPAGEVLAQETATWNVALQKQFATGGSITVGQNWNYNGSNIGTPPLLFPSVYEGNAQVQFRQPLLAGGGVEYTRIAGPVSDNIQGVSGVSQGVLIARINDDIALADFERSVQQMLHDLEALYWKLHLAYRNYDIHVTARDSALKNWQTVDFQIQGQAGPGGATEAEFRESYLVRKSQADVARDAIYSAEAELRLLMGLPVNDGRVIRPVDEPVTAEFIPDWYSSLTNAFELRPEIRRQKWNIRSLDLQRRAAKNMTLPRLDFVSGYQVNGFGDDLFSNGGGTSTGQYASAYETLTDGQQTGWNLGFQYSVPIGRRYAFSQLRTMELRLAKAHALLAEQETEISHEVAAVFRAIDRNYVSMENAYNRVLAARERLTSSQAKYHNDPAVHSIEMVSQARRALTDAELAFATSQEQYNVSLADLHLRTGRMLQVNNISLQEGPWCPAAEKDAIRNYEERRHAIPTNFRETTPPAIPQMPVPATEIIVLPDADSDPVDPTPSESDLLPPLPAPEPARST